MPSNVGLVMPSDVGLYNRLTMFLHVLDNASEEDVAGRKGIRA